MSLRWRLALVFALATAAVLGGAGLVLLERVQLTLDDSMHAQLHTREGILARFVRVSGSDLQARPLPSDPVDWPYPPEAGQTAQVFTPDDELVLSMNVPDEEPLLDAVQLQEARERVLEFRAAEGTAGDGDHLRAVPVEGPDGGSWVVVVGADLAAADAVVSQTRTALLAAGPVVILLSAGGAWLLAGASLRPVERLRRHAAALSADDTEASLEIPQTADEIASLARTMNDLLARLQQAVRRERRFVADAGHELRTPLTVLRAELELANRPGRSPAQLREAASFAAVEVDRLIRLSERLLLLATVEEQRGRTPTGDVLLNDLLAAAVHGALVRAASDVTVRLDAPERLTVPGEHDRLRQAVDNLLENALRCAPPGSEVVVSLRAGRDAGRGAALIEVTDRGPGFPPGFLGRAFDRFERAEASRTRGSGGEGLGLAITRAIVEAHGGRASAHNREDGGAAVRLELPLRPAPPATSRPAERRLPAPPHARATKGASRT